MASSAEILRSKALLLLRREREVHELKLERSRTESWVAVFHQLSLNLQVSSPTPLLQQWVEAMVGVLAFQVASVYACDEPAGHLCLLAGLGHSPLTPEIACTERQLAFLRANPAGLYLAGAASELDPLAATMGLGRFHWLLLSLGEQSLLLCAGFAESAAHSQATQVLDVRQFMLVGSYIAALASNALLIAELDREKSELQDSNQKLDVNLRKLGEAQLDLVASGKRLATASRRAGMADIATGVLHNVGNALNSVNVSAEVLFEGLRKLKTAGVARAALLIEENAGDLGPFFADERRGGKLPRYLKELGQHLGRERDELMKETQALKEHVEHIKAIVSKQQAFATAFDTSLPCLLPELVDDAIALSEHSLVRHGIVISREYEPCPEIVVDRHKVLEILVNLLKNAEDALLASQQVRRRVVARLGAAANGGVRVVIEDNGAGIVPEELERLFAFGFTTKKGGHGFGLHASALAAQELGGTLTAASQGRGKGATFTLELPQRLKSNSVTPRSGSPRASVRSAAVPAQKSGNDAGR